MLMSERIKLTFRDSSVFNASSPSLASITSPIARSVCVSTRSKILRIAAESSTIKTSNAIVVSSLWRNSVHSCPVRSVLHLVIYRPVREKRAYPMNKELLKIYDFPHESQKTLYKLYVGRFLDRHAASCLGR